MNHIREVRMKHVSYYLVLLILIATSCVPSSLHPTVTINPSPSPSRSSLAITSVPATSIITQTAEVTRTAVSTVHTQESSPEIDVLSESFILFPAYLDSVTLNLATAKSDGVPWLVASNLNGENLIPIVESCFLQMSDSSQGRVAVVLGRPGPNDRCDDYYAIPEQLAVVSTPDFGMQYITPLASYFTEIPKDIRSAIDEGKLHVVNALSAISVAKPAWSPDGRYLAFAAAIDGPTSDLYLYDSHQDEIIRVSSGPNQVYGPIWASDGSGVLHQQVIYVQEPMNPVVPYPRVLWWYEIDEGVLTRFMDIDSRDSDWLWFDGWIDRTRFLFHYVPSSGPSVGGSLMLGDIVNDETIKILEDVEKVAIIADEGNAILLATVIPKESEHGSTSDPRILYLVNIDTMQINEIPLEVNGYTQLIAHNTFTQFFVNDEDDGLVKVLSDGSWERSLLGSGINKFRLSADGYHAFVVRRRQSDELITFDSEGRIADHHSINGDVDSFFYWRPDGMVFFDRDSGDYVQLPSLEVKPLQDPLKLLVWWAWFINPNGILILNQASETPNK